MRHMNGKSPAPAILAVTVGLALAIGLPACSNSDMARQRLKEEAENNYGVMRTVTAYSQTGEEIGSWHGKIDIEYDKDSDGMTGKVDLVFFDGDEPVDRVVISGPAIVVADNDSVAPGEVDA